MQPSLNHCQDVDVAGASLFGIGINSKGRGLFATRHIPAFTSLHNAPGIVIAREEYEQHMKFTILEHYLFNSRSTGNKVLALGYGSLFNHSRTPNVNYEVLIGDGDKTQNLTDCTVRYSTGYRSVEAGEELCISYGSNLWFEDADRRVGADIDNSASSSESSAADD